MSNSYFFEEALPIWVEEIAGADLFETGEIGLPSMFDLGQRDIGIDLLADAAITGQDIDGRQ